MTYLDLTIKKNCKNNVLSSLIFILFLFGSIQNTHAQKKRDHIVLNDSAYIDGYIKIDNSNPIESVFFKWRKNDSFKKYTIHEVSEFFVNHRNYQRKTFNYQNKSETVFLEKLVYDYPKISVYKWINEKHVFFLETENGLKQLDENFREDLSQQLDIPLLDPLLEISNLNYNSLSYLLNVANSNPQSRTFSKFIMVTPQLGFISSTHHVKIPNQNQVVKLKGTGSSFELNVEVFPTYKRNISVNISPSYSSGSAFSFSSYLDGSIDFETDLFFDYTNIQIPLLARYYLEIKPNKYRGFFQLGYSMEFLKTKNGILEIAEFRSGNISTDTQTFDLSSNFLGISTGMGIEKYLKKTRAIRLGITYNSGRNSDSEKSSYLKPYLGFKF